MLANMARLSDDMAKAKGMLGTVEAAAKSLNVVLGTLGVALGSASLLVLIKGSIDAANHLEDLSKSTSMTVDELAGLSVLAKKNGTDLDGLSKAVDRMSVAMGKAPDKFRQLGVTAKNPLDALKQFSDIFNLLPDIQQRNALSQAVFSKSWAELAPILSLGGQRIGEVIAKGSQLSGVTEEIAQQATAFNSKWVELTGTGGLFTRMVGPTLPLLNVLATEMLDAAKNAGQADSSFTPLKDTLQVLAIIYANLAFMAKTAGNEIAGTAAQAALVAKFDFAGVAAVREAMLADAAKAKEELDAFEKKVMGAGLTGKAAPGAPGADPAAAAAAAAKAKEFLRDDYAARVAVIKIGGEAYAEAIRVANQLADLAMKEGGVVNQRTREDLLKEQQTNTSDQIFDLMQRQDQLRKLAQQGDQTPKKVEDAAKATAEIEKLNAKLVASETITQAQIRAERTVTAQQQAAEYNADIDAHALAGQAVAESFQTQAQIENKAYAQKLSDLEVYLAANQEQNINAAQLREKLESEHQTNLLGQNSLGIKSVTDIQKMGLDQQAEYYTSTLVNITAAGAQHNKAMFELNKVAAIANTIISTERGMAAALEWGFPLGPIFAGIIGVAGAVNVATILGTSFGSGSAPSTTAAAGGATPTFQTNSAPQAAAAPAPQQTTIIHQFEGLNDDTLLSGKQVRQLFKQIADATVNGGRLVIA